MKRLLSFLCIAFFACDPVADDTTGNGSEDNSSNNESELRPGGGCVYSPIPLKDTLYFNEQGGVDTVVTINGFAGLFKENEVYVEDEECKFIRADHYAVIKGVTEGIFWTKIESDYCKNNYCPNPTAEIIEGIEIPFVIHDDSYSAPVMKIECLWYDVAYINENSLQVSVNKNETGEERSLFIGLHGWGYCARGFTIIQSAGVR